MTSNRIKRAGARRLGVALAAFTAAALVACSSPAGDTSAGSSTPTQGGTLTIYRESTQWVNPQSERDFIRVLVDSLVYQDPNTLEFKPWLAKSWEISPDAKEFTFHLRDDVTFSDGEKLTAEGVKQYFDWYVNVAVPTGSAWFARDVWQGYQRTDVIDPLTVKVVFARGNAPFLTRAATTALGILSPASLQNSWDDITQGKYTGSGPYTMESFRPGQGMTFRVRDDYKWGPASGGTNHTGRGYLDTIDMKFVDEVSVREGALQSGEADLATGVSPNGQRALKADPSIQFASRPQPGTQAGAQWDFNNPLALDINVRRALQLAVDRDTVAERVTGPYQAAGTSVLGPKNLGFVDLAASGVLKYDPEEAKRLLEQSGWKPGADGIRVKDGKRLELVIGGDDTAVYRSELQLIKEQVKAVGFDLTLVFTSNWDAEWQGNKYTLQGINSQTDADPDILRSLFSSGSEYSGKVGNPPNNAALDALLEAQVTETDNQKRAQLIEQAQTNIIENALYIVFNQVGNVFAANAKVGGLSNFTTFSDLDYYNVWVNQ